MAGLNYDWGAERPSSRRARLQRRLKAANKAEEALLAKQALERQELEAACASRKADLEEVGLAEVAHYLWASERPSSRRSDLGRKGGTTV